MKKVLSISIIIPTYNSSKTLEPLLRSIRRQNYNQKKIEIILSDGGSIDDTHKIAKKYNAKILTVVPKEKQNAEYNRAFGALRAKNEILTFFDHDNLLPHNKLIENMLLPLQENKNIIGVETLFYHYDKKYSLLDRYFALFGVNDPLPFYLGKADRQSYMFDTFQLSGHAQDMGKYYIVSFDKTRIPTLGSNGFMVRKEILMKHANVQIDHFFHIDVNVDLIRKGYYTYAFVKDSVTHLSNHHDFISYIWRRRLYMAKYHIEDKSKRRYSVFEKKDIKKLIWFIFISLTFIKPTIDAFRGYKKIHDVAWFLHPFMCFGTVVVYGYTFLLSKVKK